MTLDAATWASLEASAAHGGTAWRRLHPDSPHDLRMVVEHGTGARSLTYTRPWNQSQNAPRLERTRALRVHNQVHATTPPTATTTLSLLDASYYDVFDALTADVSASMAAAPDTTIALRVLTRRLDHWQDLLAALGPDGLSEARRRGLVGELLVLRDLILPALAPVEAAHAWTGPRAANQDFQTGSCAVEVKTTTAKQPTGFTVASERQLDDVGVEHLLLVHLALDERRGGSGQTLNDVVDSVLVRVHDNPAATMQLRHTLVDAGYLRAHRERYDEVRYTVREQSCFAVGANFPRLTEADLPAGVGDVRYTISLSACRPYSITAAQLHSILLGKNHHDAL